MAQNTGKDWSFFKDDLKNALDFARAYLLNPIQGVRKVPDWHWPSLLIFQGATSAVAGALSGCVALSFMQVLAGFFLIPFSSLVTCFIASGFFYYVFLFGLKTEVRFKSLFTLVFLSSFPVLAGLIVAPFLPPSILVGLTGAGLLLVVGFVDHFGLPRRPVMRLIVALGAIYLVYWIANTIESRKKEEAFYRETDPENIEILEKELKGK